MAKNTYTSKPRLVIYVSKQELTKIRQAAQKAGLRNEHQWGGVILRKSLYGV